MPTPPRRRDSLLRSLLLGCAATATLAAPADARAKGGQPTTAAAEIHVFRPGEAEPTDERVARLKVPAGFRVTKWAEGLGKPRMLAVGDDGTVYVSRRQGDVVALRDKPGGNGDRAGEPRTVLTLPDAHGLAVRGGKLYVVTIHELYTAPIKPDGSVGEAAKIVGDLPDAGQHPNRTIGFGPTACST